jgi:hypothetical protein
VLKPDLNKPAFKLFPKAADDVRNSICPFCKESIDPDSFKDELSRKEFGISGLCKKCQDSVFG